MATDQPSSTPQADAPRPTEELTAAQVLRDDSAGQPDAGAGLGGGAAAPNSPIDADLPHDGGSAQAEQEARLLSTSGGPAEPGHTTQ